MDPNPKPRAAAILVAAGASTRMGPGAPDRKPFLEIEGRAVVQHVCAAFDRAPSVAEIVLVAHPEDLERLRALARAAPELAKVRSVVPGGEERADSVRRGVEAVSADVDVLCVHDVARPLVAAETIERAVRVAAERGAALVAVPVRDTVKRASDGERAEETLDRSSLWCAQTPQAFRADLFRALLARAREEGFRPTDDSALHERYAGPVPLVEGRTTNIKITTAEDLEIAAALLRSRGEGRSQG